MKSYHEMKFLYIYIFFFFQYCNPSCQAQAWSVSTVLETLHDMEYIV